MPLATKVYKLLAIIRGSRNRNLEIPWEIPHFNHTTPEDIYYCFRLILGRSPNQEEWRGHSAHAFNTKLDDVVMSYTNSLEFARRKNDLRIESWDDALTLREFDLFRIYIREGDAAVGRGINFGIYEPHVAAVFKDRLKEGMNVLDIGANVGFFTLMTAALVKASGSVLAIEPNPENTKLLELSRRANNFENVTILQAAAGRELGLLVLNTSYSNGTTSALSEDVAQVIDATTVPSLRIDDIVAEKHIDFIKIDVEGAEYNALLGASKLIRRCHPVIVSEFSPNLMPTISGIEGRQYLKFLFDFGYSASVIVEDAPLEPCGNDMEKILRVFEASGVDHIDILFE